MSTYAFASQRVAASSSGLVDGWQTSGHDAGEGNSATAARATIAVRTRDRTNGASTLRAADTAAMVGARRVAVRADITGESAPRAARSKSSATARRGKTGLLLGEHVRRPPCQILSENVACPDEIP